MTVREAWRRYALEVGPRLKGRTLANRRSLFRQILAELGTVDLAAIDEARLARYAEKRRRHIKAVSVNNELRAFAMLRNWVSEKGGKVGAAPRRLPERPAFDVRSWSREQVTRLLREVDRESPALRPIVFTLANTGLRCGEALALRWSRVDLERRLLYVWPSDEWQPKSGRPREVPINDDLGRLLAELPRRGAYVFPSSRGTRWAYWPELQFNRARRAAGLSGGPHTLRHTYATEFLAAGGTIELLAQILGHSDEETTRIYAHLRPEHLVAARNIVRLGIARRRGLIPDLVGGLRALARRAVRYCLTA